MKRLLVFVFAVALLWSCGEKSSQERLIGSWDVYEGGTKLVGSTTFSSDFTVRIDRGSEIEGKWSITPNFLHNGELQEGLCLSDGKRKDECFAIIWLEDNNSCMLFEENDDEYVTLKRK